MIKSVFDGKIRCFGNNELYAQYHDKEWGIPSYDDRYLFEILTLEGAQAGLNWETILKKREGYRKAFYFFDVKKVANMSDEELEKLRTNPEIIRNRLKIFSTRTNAQIFIKIQKEYSNFSNYVWSFTSHKPIKNNWKSFNEIPVTTPESDALAKDLKKRGMKFCGSTIMYAYMQAIGMVDDHTQQCHLKA